MTAGPDPAAELFGLADAFPRPGWVVLDAARDHRFTGELIFDLTPPVRIYFDRGEIYLAERASEPPLEVRLIDAGALNAAQLEHGAMLVGDTAHLGRLFERVPSIDRDVVLLMTEMMNDECVAWVAGQEVRTVRSTPYLRHPSGTHHWHRSGDDVDLSPGDALPAPPPTATPVPPPTPVNTGTPITPEPDTDTLVAWGRPETNPTDQKPASAPPDRPAPAASTEQPTAAVAHDSILQSDWVDRLETHGLPEIGSDPLAVPAALPAVPTGQRDRFELIWPSGEIDEEFDAGAALDHLHERDHDRAGPTARVKRSTDVGSEPDEPASNDTFELWDFENTAPSFGPAEDRPVTADPDTGGRADSDRAHDDSQLTVITDSAVMSMRRAVESIEVESLAVRPVERTDDTSTTTGAVRADDLVVPGRVATRTESSLWSIRGFDNTTNRSVFDETTPPPTDRTASAVPSSVAAMAVAGNVPVAAPEHTERHDAPRVSALRRLIGGLRFR